MLMVEFGEGKKPRMRQIACAVQKLKKRKNIETGTGETKSMSQQYVKLANGGWLDKSYQQTTTISLDSHPTELTGTKDFERGQNKSIIINNNKNNPQKEEK